MKYLKQFAEWVIKLKHNLFDKARLILTLYYIVIIAIIMGFFSILLYFALIENIRDSLKDQFYDDIIEEEVYSQTVDQVRNVIVVSDIVLLSILTFSSYFLANKTLKPIQKSLADQRKFSADASHELRTPLAVMQSESEIVLRKHKAKNEDYIHTLKSNLEEVSKMKKIIEDLLLIARGDRRIDKDSLKRFDVSLLIDKIGNKMQSMAEMKNLAINKSLEENLFIYSDPYFIEHAISNIINNAIKYTNTGHVLIESFSKGKYAYIKITDTGIGIEEKDLPYIMDRFYKAERTRNNSEGTGLGLAIANEIIKDHKGNIKIQSIVDKGTIVTIIFSKS